MNGFGISIKIDGVGYLDGVIRDTLHEAKSTAGRLFHKDPVKAVCVYDEGGVARLYLKKTPNGVVREER